MGRKYKKSDAGLIVLALIIGGPIWLFQNYPAIAIILIVVIIVGVFLIAMPKNCDICDTQLKRKVYKWQIDGKNKKLCPNCNRELERRKSREAISRL